ncbi:MAG: RAD55 family ATPase [Halorientalis sp.]
MYDLSPVLDSEAVSAVRPGTSVLVAGPPMTGKADLAMDILAAGARDGEGALVITTNDTAESVVEDFRGRVPEVETLSLGVVDCRGDETGGGSSPQAEPGVFYHHVGSPSDLTGIGIGITKCLESLHESGADRGRMALISLSTMLTYTDRETVFKFCHVLSSRLDAAGYLGVFTIDTGAHDDQTVQVIKQAFDGLVEIREGDAGREARVLGLSDAPTGWAAL